MLRTYQTKIKTDNTDYLDEAASFFGLIERKLFVHLFIHKKEQNACKRDFLNQYKISSRQYNAIRIILEGKIKSLEKKNNYDINQLNEKIMSIEYDLKMKCQRRDQMFKQMDKMNQNEGFIKKYRHLKMKIHHKKRRLHRLYLKRKQLKNDQETQKIRICFGGRALFRKQFNMNQKDWKKKWKSTRNSTLYCIGSKDEKGGNQTCVYIPEQQALRLRVFDQFVHKYGKYIVFDSVTFPYGQVHINQGLETYMARTRGNRMVKYCRSAISYRFIKKDKGWYLHASVQVEPLPIQTTRQLGCIGVDLNAGFVSLCEIDRFGNPINQKRIQLTTYNRRSKQVEATIGDVVKEIVAYSVRTNKPLAIEKLDFSKKKTSLKEQSKQAARMLSGFAYSQFSESLKRRVSKYGVEVIDVSAAYSSIIGQIKYMKRYGLSSHGSAACVIARRGIGFNKEKPLYINPLGNFSDLINRPLNLYKRWIVISKQVKQNPFKTRIQKLVTN